MMKQTTRNELISLAKAGQKRDLSSVSQEAAKWIAENPKEFERLCNNAKFVTAKACKRCGMPGNHCLCSYLNGIAGDGQSDRDHVGDWGSQWLDW